MGEGGGEDEVVVLGVAPGVDVIDAGIGGLAAEVLKFLDEGGCGVESDKDRLTSNTWTGSI